MSAKLEVSVLGESLLRYLLAKSDLICLVQGSKPADHGSDDLALNADFFRAGGAAIGLRYIGPFSASAAVAEIPSCSSNSDLVDIFSASSASDSDNSQS